MTTATELKRIESEQVARRRLLFALKNRATDAALAWAEHVARDPLPEEVVAYSKGWLQGYAVALQERTRKR